MVDGLSPEEQQMALSQGLLGLGAGLLSGSYGHYGAFAPALSAGAEGFQQGYGNALTTSMRLKTLRQQKELQDAQIQHYNFQNGLLAAQEEQRRRAAENEAYDRGLTSPAPSPMPGQSPSFSVPPAPPISIDPQSQAVVRGIDIGTPQGTPLPDPAKLFPSQPKYPIDFMGGPQAGPVQQSQPVPTRAADIPVTGKTTEATLALDQVNYWKDLASKARTKEYRDQYYNNYRDAYGKYIDLVKQENTGDLYQTVPDAPGVVRKKNSDLFFLNGSPIDAEKVQAIVQATKKAGATNVDIKNTLSTEKKYGEAFAGKIADQDATMRDTAIKAPDIAQRANAIKEVLASGKVITGTGADYRLALGKALGIVGMSDKETIANTEQLVTELSRNTLDAIKASGLGSGTGFSNADRDFLEKAVGGKVTLEATTINRLADLAHRAAVKSAEKWNSRVKMIPDSALNGTGIDRTPIEVPPLFQESAKKPKAMLPRGWSVERDQ